VVEATEMKNKIDFIGGCILGIALGLWLSYISQYIFGRTYKDGQIDALTGKVKYELVTHPDSTKTWESIK
jgi:hypothetical protein